MPGNSLNHLVDGVSAGALSGTFWSMLLGSLFHIPDLGIAVGVAVDAQVDKLSLCGVDHNFIYGLNQKIIEGTSPLLPMTSGEARDKFTEAIKV